MSDCFQKTKQPLKGCLDWVKTELYISVFITHNPKHVRPIRELLFGKIFESCSHHSKLKKKWVRV